MAVSSKNSRIPKQQRAMESKENIIIAAMELFAEKGYSKTNALEIAARAEVATGTFYGYFNNKKEVFIEIIKRISGSIVEKVTFDYKMRMHKKRVDNYRELKDMVHFMIHHIFSEYAFFNVQLLNEILSMTILDEQIAEMRLEVEKDVINFLIPYMQEYRQYIRVTDFEVAAILIVNLVEHTIQKYKSRNTDIDEKRFLKEIEDMICRYLLPSKDL